jgi:transposase
MPFAARPPYAGMSKIIVRQGASFEVAIKRFTRWVQQARRATRPGQPAAFGQAIYARRNVVGRCINRLKQWRGLAMRYKKRAVNYRVLVDIAFIAIWLHA